MSLSNTTEKAALRQPLGRYTADPTIGRMAQRMLRTRRR